MKRHLLIFFVLLLGTNFAYSQPYTIWSKTYGDLEFQSFRSLLQTSDGNIIAVGRTERPFGINNFDVWIVKTDAWGDTLWTRTIGNIWDFWDDGQDVKEVIDGGLIITGYTFLPFAEILGEALLIKTDSNGNMEWNRHYSGPGIQDGRSIDITSDGGFIISASTTDTNSVKNVLVIRTNFTGDTLWTRIIGGSDDDEMYQVLETSNGDYILVGESRSFSPDSVFRLDLWFVRMDDAGNVLWSKSYEYRGWARAESVLETVDGSFVMIGVTSRDDLDALLVKTDAGGDTLWTMTYMDTTFEVGRSIIQTEVGGFVFTGYVDDLLNDDVWMVSVDSMGSFIWSKTFDNGIQDRGEEIINFPGGFVVAGRSHFEKSEFPFVHTDGLLIRMGDALSRLALRNVRANEDDLIELPVIYNYPHELNFNSVEVRLSGYKPYLSFLGINGVGAAVGDMGWQYESSETEDGFSVRLWGDSSLSAMDTLFFATFIVDSFTSELITITIDSGSIDSSAIPLELFSGTVQLIPIVGVSDDNSSLPDRYYLSQNYPNPFNPATTIKFDLPAGAHTTLIIYNILGQEVNRLADEFLEQGSYRYRWDATGKPSGMYIYKLTSGYFVQSRKMVLLR